MLKAEYIQSEISKDAWLFRYCGKGKHIKSIESLSVISDSSNKVFVEGIQYEVSDHIEQHTELYMGEK